MGILNFETATNQAVCAIHPSTWIAKNYLYYFFRSHQAKLAGQAVGNAQPNISQAKIRATELPMPELKEQERVSIRLWNMQDKVQELEDTYTTKLTLLAELRQSLLARAFAGELT